MILCFSTYPVHFLCCSFPVRSYVLLRRKLFILIDHVRPKGLGKQNTSNKRNRRKKKVTPRKIRCFHAFPKKTVREKAWEKAATSVCLWDHFLLLRRAASDCRSTCPQDEHGEGYQVKIENITGPLISLLFEDALAMRDVEPSRNTRKNCVKPHSKGGILNLLSFRVSFFFPFSPLYDRYVLLPI
jgi:hypothetical protein